MKQELDEALVRDFPNLYGDRNADMRQTAMCWGFECSDGWEPLLRDLSFKLETLIKELPENEREYVKASQVKEKYGTLRFYMTRETYEMSYHIGKAEHKSSITCEQCGSKGSLRSDGWVSCQCDKCYKDHLISGLMTNCKHRLVEVDPYVSSYDGSVTKRYEYKDKQELKEVIADIIELYNEPPYKRSLLSKLKAKGEVFVYRCKNPTSLKYYYSDLKQVISYKVRGMYYELKWLLKSSWL